VWLLRLAMAGLPFTVGPALADALAGASRSVQLVASAGLWAGWAIGLVAALVPQPVSLTAIRLLAPAAPVAAIAAVLTGEPSAAASVSAVVSAAVVALVAFAPAIGELYVNGAAYGDERRFPLRPPGPLLFGPLELTWALVVVAPAIGALLLADRRWVGGAIVLAVAVPAAVIGARSLHGLARRWVVFVPAGLVLHDPMALADPVLFQRRMVRSLAPAVSDSAALDLTQRALGLALELGLAEAAPLAVVVAGRRETNTVEAPALLFAPTRPGEVLTEAERRRLPVG
jgi:hypothetical protein